MNFYLTYVLFLYTTRPQQQISVLFCSCTDTNQNKTFQSTKDAGYYLKYEL